MRPEGFAERVACSDGREIDAMVRVVSERVEVCHAIAGQRPAAGTGKGRGDPPLPDLRRERSSRRRRMLVLGRALKERVLINPGEPDQITVSVELLTSGVVRLGFTAPKRTVIQREEVWRGQARRPNRRADDGEREAG